MVVEKPPLEQPTKDRNNYTRDKNPKCQKQSSHQNVKRRTLEAQLPGGIAANDCWAGTSVTCRIPIWRLLVNLVVQVPNINCGLGHPHDLVIRPSILGDLLLKGQYDLNICTCVLKSISGFEFDSVGKH